VVGRWGGRRRRAPLFLLFTPLHAAGSQPTTISLPHIRITLPHSGAAMLRIVSSVLRPSSTGLLGKVAVSTHAPHSSQYILKESGRSCWLKQRTLNLGRRSFSSTSSRGADITLTVDGKEVTVPQGSFCCPGLEGHEITGVA